MSQNSATSNSSPDWNELELLEELWRRRQARQTVEAFVQSTSERWQPGKLHKIVCEQFDRVERREIDRLMLLEPPQHGKSHIASRRYPAFTLGRDPTHDVISASATATLAEEFGRDVRNLINSKPYGHLFPATSLAEDSQAQGSWHTAQGGSYYAVGIGGALMGRGATRAIIDDPFASWEDAQSEQTRNRVWEWYTGTLYNRVRPTGAIVLIQHRMHEADLAGRLIEQMKAGKDKWEVVELPAINPAGEALWPERYDLRALERIRVNTHPLKWSALYQQNPLPDEGLFFKKEWFEFFDPAKVPRCHKYMSGDFAVTEGDGDWTEIATHGYSMGDLYLALDGWAGQTTADVWIEELLNQAVLHQPFCFFGEGGPIRRAIEPFLIRRMRERTMLKQAAGIRCEWLTRGHDKPTMARPLQAMASMGKVKIADTPYGHRLLAQLLKFPAGQLDDGVDMAALMAMAIALAHPAIISPEIAPESPRGARTFDEVVRRHESRQDEYGRI